MECPREYASSVHISREARWIRRVQHTPLHLHWLLFTEEDAKFFMSLRVYAFCSLAEEHTWTAVYAVAHTDLIGSKSTNRILYIYIYIGRDVLWWPLKWWLWWNKTFNRRTTHIFSKINHWHCKKFGCDDATSASSYANPHAYNRPYI